jgi:hypothetical protein
LKTKELIFWRVQKSAQEFEKKRDSSETRGSICKSERLNVEEASTVPEWEEYPHTPAVFVRVANKGLAGYGTWKSVRKMGDRETEG